jgi:hypothetical protein
MRTIEVGGSETVYFDVFQTDNISPALSEEGNQPQTLLNAGTFSDNGIGTLTHNGYGRYSATLDTSALSVAVGDVIRTRYKGVTTAESFGDSFVVVTSDNTVFPDAASVSYYGSVGSGDLFFNNRLNVRKWTNSSNADKIKALTMATQIIDRLNFAGNKASDGQVLQFPRMNSYTDPVTLIESESSDDQVPSDIKNATYLIAYKLLDGYDPDAQAQMLAVEMSKYQSVQTYYQRDYIPEYMQAGVPSSEAWNYLRPYLRDPREVELSRV